MRYTVPFIEQNGLRNSHLILAMLVSLFALNCFGVLRAFSLGFFGFVIPIWITLREYKAGNAISYPYLMNYWMILSILIYIEGELQRLPLFYCFEVALF
jgi:hypothetical protein